MIKDLRDFVSKLEDEGELKRVKTEVSPNMEASACVIKSLEEHGPALLFEKIKGFPDGYRLVSGIYAGAGLLYLDYTNPKRRPWTRTAISMGLSVPINYEEFIDKINERYTQPTIKPLKVKKGACKENVKLEKEAKITSFPVPKLTKWDGGSYINAATLVFTDPETKFTYYQKYNCMIKKDRELAINVPPQSPLDSLLKKVLARKETLPISISIGGPPTLLLPSYTTIPPLPGVSEIDYACALANNPIELVPGEVNEEIMVPADSEIVIEGEITEDKTEEGPYLTFYSYTQKSLQPKMSIKAITHRDNPILPFIVEPARFNDTLILTSIFHSAELVRVLRPRFQLAWLMLPPEAGMAVCVVSTKNLYQGMLWFMAYTLFTHSKWFDKVLFVENTVLPEDALVYWNDWVTKSDPSRSWYRDESGWPRPLSARYPVDPKVGTARMYVDATWNPRWPERWKPEKALFENCYPEDLQKKVIERWRKGEYGYKVEPYVRRARELPLK